MAAVEHETLPVNGRRYGTTGNCKRQLQEIARIEDVGTMAKGDVGAMAKDGRNSYLPNPVRAETCMRQETGRARLQPCRTPTSQAPSGAEVCFPQAALFSASQITR